MIDPRLVLFARFPAAGACKTRLIPALGANGAAALHRRLTERTIEVLGTGERTVTVAFTGAGKGEFSAWLGPKVHLAEQAQGGLSARLMACLEPAPVIFFGADTPDLLPRHVDAAILALHSHEVVIGPAEDGGYYLIGMRMALPELLIDMPWSTEQVLPETLARLTRLGIVPSLLETLADCDRPEDLARWPDLVSSCASPS
ncbi:MAG: TIGR04282 family arsenosugar biosynthesis glycosyltransferase [Porphyrobacter sp.]|nr:TIGR04282 family arsenosugar biosynthesis glycosyltransferase [Porphyrobacter sp.]